MAGKMDKKEASRKLGSSLGGTAIGFLEGRLSDSIGLPYAYVLGLAAVACYAFGWWPQIAAMQFWTRARAIFAIVAACLVVMIGGWASFYFNPKPPPPRVRITDLTPVTGVGPDDLRFNINYINDGPGFVRALRARGGVATSKGGRLSADKEDGLFKQLEVQKPEPNNKTETAMGAPGMWTFPEDVSKPSDLTRKRLEEWGEDKQILYVFAAVSYFDGKSNDIWNTERCEWWDLGLPKEILQRASPHFCIGHNGVYGPEKAG
jgi:hypothetical protein